MRVADEMTMIRHAVTVDDTVAEACARMKNAHVRHLPVVEAEVLVGVVSERDLKQLMTDPEVDAELETVEVCMRPEPYAVPPDTDIREVAREMEQRRIGSAIVLDGEKVLGIFTTTDALRVLADCLERAEAQG